MNKGALPPSIKIFDSPPPPQPKISIPNGLKHAKKHEMTPPPILKKNKLFSVNGRKGGRGGNLSRGKFPQNSYFSSESFPC